MLGFRGRVIWLGIVFKGLGLGVTVKGSGFRCFGLGLEFRISF